MRVLWIARKVFLFPLKHKFYFFSVIFWSLWTNMRLCLIKLLVIELMFSFLGVTIIDFSLRPVCGTVANKKESNEEKIWLADALQNSILDALMNRTKFTSYERTFINYSNLILFTDSIMALIVDALYLGFIQGFKKFQIFHFDMKLKEKINRQEFVGVLRKSCRLIE